MKTRKFVASTAAVVTLGMGGLAVAAVNPFTAAGAATPTTAPAAPGASTTGRGHLLAEALGGLVKDGTITQAQADAVTAALKADLRKHGVLHRIGANRKAIADTAAKAIGIPTQDLVTAVKGGQSIADVAKAHGVDPKVVTDALVKEATTAVDKAVAEGKVTADQAAKIKARLPQIAQKLVDHHRKQ